jgi:probable F420-dependent oxidoreductase
MPTRPLRFGVSLLAPGSRSAWQSRARQVEDLGYDVLQVPDHLGMPAPFPALVSAAEATTAVRLGTLVLNTGFYRPAVLARDVAHTDQLTDGRLELGLGAGYLAAEFEAAELPFPAPGRRIDHLAHTVAELRTLFASEPHTPPVLQRPHPPLLLGGVGDRMLRLAAKEADIVGFPLMSLATPPGGDPRKVLAERIGFVRTEAGERFGGLELNLFVSAVVLTDDGEPDMTTMRRIAPTLTDEQILRLPNVLVGSEREIADTLTGYRETYGLTYFSVLEAHMADFARVIAHLR